MGGRLTTPFFAETVIIGSSIVLVSLVPYSTGHTTMAFAVLVGGMVALVAVTALRFRWRPARTVTVEESIDLAHPCHTVWDLIEDPENAPLLDPTCYRGYRVPGTPDGVGAQQAIQHVGGMTNVIEVIEVEPGRRAVSRTVSPPLSVNVRISESVDPIDGGCRYTIAQQHEVGRGRSVPRSEEKEWRAQCRARLERTRDVLAGTVAADGDRPTQSVETSLPSGSVGMLRRWLRTPFFKETVLLALCVVLFGLTLFGAGHQTVAVTFVVSGSVLLAAWTLFRFRRWPARVLTVEESIDLTVPCETVWRLIDDPENAPLLDPAGYRGYRVPGTPRGVGEQRAFQSTVGGTVVREVIEYEPGRRATTRLVSPPVDLDRVDSVDPIDGGCRYTIALQVGVQPGVIVPRSAVTHVRALQRVQLERVREVLAVAGSARDDPSAEAEAEAAPGSRPTVLMPEQSAAVDVAHQEGTHQSARVVTLQESVQLPWSCDAVWDVITSPEMVPVLDRGFIRAYRIPGTPEGVGEWWAHEIATGATVIYETVEYDRPRRLVVQPALPVPDSRTVTTLLPVDGGCLYTVSTDKHRDTSSPEDFELDERWRRATRVRIAGLQRALASKSGPADLAATQPADARPPKARPTRVGTRALTGRDALAVCATGAAVIALAWFDLLVVASVAVLLVAFAVLAGPRLARRLRQPRTVTIQESIRLPWSCDEVWPLIESAENTPRLDPSVRVGFQVPGTPRGVGERHASVTPTGVVFIEEIVEIVQGRRIAWELVSPRAVGHRHAVESLEPVEGGCVYTVTVKASVPRGATSGTILRESLVQRLERTRDVLASSAGHPDA